MHEMIDSAHWIKRLGLARHPEGGYFREIYRSDELIGKDSLPHRYEGSRSFCTSIYFLLEWDEFSHLHRLKSDELWHFYTGSPLTIHIIDQTGDYSLVRLGNDIGKGEVFQTAIRASTWFGATVDNPTSYSLIGCTVAPGFDFADFELANQERLLDLYPKHTLIIKRLTKPAP